MSAEIVYGTDFARGNPKADRAFWIGVKAEEAQMAGECEDQIAARRATPSPPPKDRA